MIVELAVLRRASTSPGRRARRRRTSRRPAAVLVGYEGDRRRSARAGMQAPADDGACEIKRMYVVPEARGRGVAGALLEALEDEARDARLRRDRAAVDTGPTSARGRARCTGAAGYERASRSFNANPSRLLGREARPPARRRRGRRADVVRARMSQRRLRRAARRLTDATAAARGSSERVARGRSRAQPPAARGVGTPARTSLAGVGAATADRCTPGSASAGRGARAAAGVMASAS